MVHLSDRVPLLDLVRQTATIRPEIEAAIARVLDHGQFILGPEVGEIEGQLARYCGTRFAVACASGSDAILLPLMALNAGFGDRVLTTPYSFFATAGSIARLGAIPVFVDIDPATYNLDPAKLSTYLNSCDAATIKSIKAVLPVDLYGRCADMPAIAEIAGRFGIPVIEDAAQAIGAECGNSRAGSLGLCGTFSFFPSKNLGAMGDGGAITTDDEALAERLRMLRGHGSSATYYHSVVGINSRLDTIQAAILLVKLRYLEEWTASRRAHAALYRELIDRELAGRVMPPLDDTGGRHIYNQFTVRVPNRDKVRQKLTELGIGSAIYYPLPLHLQECFAYLGYREGDLPHSEAAARETLSLPIEPGLTTEDIETVIARLGEAIG